MNIGGAIEGLRKKKNIKQNVLAEKAEITQSYLSLIESNKKEPNLKTLKAIADGLEVPLPIIFFLSITPDDIPVEKQESYKLLSPLVNSVIKDIFIA
ncbi:XRE family transcriptional regulator [Chitinophaga silvatica]|uniref:XRE family transcriptional regulator n=1 Tax=Chitinophaga silvatica TaxID=2282649 RepID=A0A3E1YCE0_9BACT|nr:helix-turn-helix transcriptional regulator [Chitinophaga silvatica]RFS23928.1 XRE family transcriptional regulator [Chitinophaga silvatica]